MKNYLTLVLALAVVSSPAFASTARLQALGEDANGSYYIQDSRNMFLNPSEIVHFKKKLMLETASKEASFINTFGDYTYGVTLNRVSDAAKNTFGSILTPKNGLEVGVAGENTVHWGLSVAHSGANTAGNVTNTNVWGARFGVGKDAWNVRGTIGLYGDSKTTGAEIKSKSNIDLGASYAFDSMTAFAKFVTSSTDGTVAATTTNTKYTGYGVGVGYKKEMTKSTTMYSRLEADRLTKTVSSDTTTWNVPLTLAAETQALSWLAVRASIAQSLLAQNSSDSSTSVGAGLGLTFGDLNIDALVADNAAFNTNAALGTGGANTGSTFGFGNGMLANVAMTYNF